MSTHSHSGNLSPASSLRGCFGALVEQTFMQTLGVYEPGVTEYLTGVLTDFVHIKNVYKIKNLQGRTLTEVADMLLEADVRLHGTPFSREREVHKHIGDFVLFWAGVYPEALPGLRERTRKDHLVDYVRQGKQSYAIAAAFDDGEYCPQACLFKKLSDEFELCLYGLNMVRKELDALARPS